MDDIPVFLTADRLLAEGFAITVDPTMDGEHVNDARDVLGLDIGTPLNVSIYTFADGVLFRCQVVQDLSEEE
jgi:hypothetical protein